MKKDLGIYENDWEENGVLLFPPWKQAVEDAEKQFDYGDIIEHEWLNDALNVPKLKDPGQYSSSKEMESAVIRANLYRIQQLDRFKVALLETYQKALVSHPGVGYRIVPPEDQGKVAMKRFQQKVRKEETIAIRTMNNVNQEKLTQAQLQDLSEERARLVHLMIVREERRLPGTKK